MSVSSPAKTDLHPGTRMGDLVAAFPGARRALFARYHIGGCQSCAYRDDETIADVCERNEDLPVDEVIAHIEASHEEDRQILIDPAELQALLKSGSPPALIDLRTREEHEAVALEGSTLFSNELTHEIFGHWPKDRSIVVYDHTGDRCLDAAAYLIGHGYRATRALRGGIDAWSREIDPGLPRYLVEFE